MESLKAFWGCFWRASLCGVIFGAGFGALYGAAFGTLIFSYIGTIFGCFFGVPTGAVVGLPLGLLNGLLLFGFTMSYRNAEHLNSRRYRLQAGILCVVGNFLALIADWLQHNFPDPDGFATSRAQRLVLKLFSMLDDPSAGVPTDVLILVIWAFVPMVMILFASWLKLAGSLPVGARKSMN